MARNHGIARRVVSVVSSVALALSLCPFGQAFAIEPGEGQPSELSSAANGATGVDCLDVQADYYVKSDGNDLDSNSGNSPDSPLASLSEAVDRFNKSEETDVTICVVGKVTSSKCARITDNADVDKNVKIVGRQDEDGTPATIVRSESFDGASDDARSWYNPALVEVTNPKGHNVTLTLQGIVLDDAGHRAGYLDESGEPQPGYLKQAISGDQTGASIKNEQCAQDSIVAGYKGDNGSVEIVLGDAATLKNFGGMSAVRATGGVKLTMQDGSLICDDVNVNVDRDKAGNDPDEVGAAGAVWIQGGEFNMLSEARISGMKNARAVYLDSGSAEIGGLVSDISLSAQSWQGASGAVYARGTGEVDISGTVEKILTGNCAVYAIGSDAENMALNIASGGKVSDCGKGVNGVQIYNKVTSKIDGTISGMLNACALHINVTGWPSDGAVGGSVVTLGPQSKLTGNTVGVGAIYINSYGTTLNIYGEISKNNNAEKSGEEKPSALWASNNFGGNFVNIYNGASIVDNNGGGAAVIASLCEMTMYGGEIARNNVDVGLDSQFGGVRVRRGGRFIMKGGSIHDNGKNDAAYGGVSAQVDRYSDLPSAVEIDGGEIFGNAGSDLSVVNTSPGPHGSADTFAKVSDSAIVKNPSIPVGSIVLEGVSAGVKFGNADESCEKNDEIKKLGTSNLSNITGSFWFQSNHASETFAISKLPNFDESKPVYAAVVPTAKDGTCDSQKSVSLVPAEVDENGLVKVTVPASGATGQAVVFLQEGDQSASVVSITPVDLTSYMGGEDGYAGDGTIPEPGFLVSCPNGVDAANVVLSATIDGTSHSWGFEKLDASNGKEVYRLVSADEEGNGVFPVEFLNSTGESVRDDGFEFDTALSQTIFVRAFDGVSAKAKFPSETGGDVEAIVSSGVGELTVRGTTEGEKYASPNAGFSVGQPGLKTPEGTGYAVNGGGVEVADKEGIALLFDDIIETNGISMNADLLEDHAEQECFEGEDGDRSYEFKYLDLVDRNNGNVWVEASEPVTVCWPLPEGTDSGDKFTVLHFKGLHREMGVGYIESEIDKSDVEKLDCRVVGDHVEFEVTSGNFSPFALVWTEDGGGSVTPPQPQTVTLHYETNGGRPLADETHVLGTKADLKTPLREGCTFAGWYLDDALTKPAEDPLTMDADKTVWAKWESTAVPGGFTSDHVNYVLGRDTDQGRLIMPESNITRAEAAAMFYRLLDEGTRAEYYRESSTFPDVEPGAWYEPAVGTLQAMGILRGDDGVGTVRPDDPITRAELAAMAGRFDDDGEWPDMEPFADMDGHWAERIVLVAAENGWVLGVEGSDKFRPDDPITRAETMAIANRVLQRLPEDESDLIAGRVQWPDNQDKEKWYWLAVEEATNNHDHTLKSDGVHERWTALLENEDWGE